MPHLISSPRMAITAPVQVYLSAKTYLMNDAQATATDPTGPRIVDNPNPPPPAYHAFKHLGTVTGLSSRGHGVLGLLWRLNYGVRNQPLTVLRHWWNLEQFGALSIVDSSQPLTLDEYSSSFDPDATTDTTQVYKGKLAFEVEIYRVGGGARPPRTTEPEVTLTLRYTANNPSVPPQGELSGEIAPQFLNGPSSFIMTFDPVIDFSSSPQASQTYGMSGGLLHFY